MFYCKKDSMKCPRYKTEKMEKNSAAVSTADSKAHEYKASPVKVPTPVKPQCPPIVFLSQNDNIGAVHNKENSTTRDHDRTMDDGFEDSGYLSLQNSQIEDHHGDEEDDQTQGKMSAATLLPSAAITQQRKIISPKSSPSKCRGRTNSGHPVPLLAASHPVSCQRRTEAYSMSSTQSDHLCKSNLPILKFKEAVCEELAKSYRKNKR